MVDDTGTNDIETPDTENKTEPVTEHEAAEGGVLGAIGGAIVGGLAGGPIGALVGAVLGGIASAGAVEAVERHDHVDAVHGDAVQGENTVDQADIVQAESTDLPDEAMSVSPIGAVTPVTLVEEPVTSLDAPDLSSQIRERAYEIYEQRGRSDGHDVEDWLEAEREILAG